MSAKPFYIGDWWIATATITNPATGALVDPNEVEATFTSPAGTTTSATVTRSSVGVDVAQIKLTEPGTWHAIFTTIGNYEGVETQNIRCHDPALVL